MNIDKQKITLSNSEVRDAKQIGFFLKMTITKKKENSHNPVGVKLLTLLRLQLSHLNEHTFRYGLEDTIRPMCSCKNRK